ncbi:MAG TPA: hypothetical protein VLM42_19285 [Bryobacteraceae bacterium]|nr:hypothetical protein [Bryobacteraceae bacterium]
MVELPDAPRAGGKPDLSGVWMHEITSVAEVKRLFGSRFDAEIELARPAWRSAPNTSTASIFSWTSSSELMFSSDNGVSRHGPDCGSVADPPKLTSTYECARPIAPRNPGCILDFGQRAVTEILT